MIDKELLRKIRRIEIRTNRVVSEALAGHYHSAFRGRGMEFEEVRPYQVGDDVRAIDWNVSARYGEPYVKIFREERELTVLLLVDLSRSQAFGTNHQLKRELVAEIGATLALSASRNSDKIGLIGFTDRIERVVPPRKGKGHVLRVIRELLAFDPVGRGTDIAGAIEHLNRIQRRRAVVFVISDFLDDGYERPLRIAARRHDVVLVRVADELESELPGLGLLEVVDPETGATELIDTGSRAWRRAFAAQRARVDEARARLFRQSRVDAVELRTGESFIEPLAKLFRTRELRR